MFSPIGLLCLRLTVSIEVFVTSLLSVYLVYIMGVNIAVVSVCRYSFLYLIHMYIVSVQKRGDGRQVETFTSQHER